MKTIIIITFAAALLAFTKASNFSEKQNNPQERDWNSCMQKYASAWGAYCEKCIEYKGYKVSHEDTYTVKLKNSCEERLDVKCCVQETDLSWRCFLRQGIAPNDSLIAYACKGKGKYLYWTKKAGDTEVVFPTDEEVNAKYKE